MRTIGNPQPSASCRLVPMRSKFSLLTVSLGFLLSTTLPRLLATTSGFVDDDWVPPKPISVVPPARAPLGYENVTVRLEFVVDVHGLPQHIDILGLNSTEAQELIISAFKKWKFTPATRHGIPVCAHVILPLKLAVAKN